MHKLIDLTINEEQLKKTVESAKERNVIIPTLAQMKDPNKIPLICSEFLGTTNL